MIKILEMLDYDIKNMSGDHNRKSCVIDFIFLIIYSCISLFSSIETLSNAPPQVMVSEAGMGTINWLISTLSIVLINIIILIRMNIALYLREKDNKEYALSNLIASGKPAMKIIITVWGRRKFILVFGYVIDIITVLFCIYWGSTVVTTLNVIAIIAVIETLIHEFIDKLEIMYEATPNVYGRI